MTYSREVTHKIVECWGLGFTAEETVDAIEQWKNVRIGLATVYRHRHSLTADKIIDELIRKQLRDIAKEDNSDIRMKYRDKILEKLIPQRIETMGVNVERVEHVVRWESQKPLSTSSDTHHIKVNKSSTTA